MFNQANDRSRWTIQFALPLFLIAIWWLPKLYNPYSAADEFTAKALQLPLQLYRPWQIICAYLNADLFDAAMYIAIIGHTLFAFWQLPSFEKREEIKRFILYYFLLSFAQYCFKQLLHTAFQWHRLSPSLSLINAVRVPADSIGLIFKDASRRSFPGDHALFLFSWALFWYKGYSKAILTSALIIASFFSLPRLLIGGHWLSDLILGGVLPAWIFANFAMERKQKESKGT